LGRNKEIPRQKQRGEKEQIVRRSPRNGISTQATPKNWWLQKDREKGKTEAQAMSSKKRKGSGNVSHIYS